MGKHVLFLGGSNSNVKIITIRFTYEVREGDALRILYLYCASLGASEAFCPALLAKKYGSVLSLSIAWHIQHSMERAYCLILVLKQWQ